MAWYMLGWPSYEVKGKGRQRSEKIIGMSHQCYWVFFTHRPLTCINTNHWSDDGRLESCCQRHMSINRFAVNARETISKRQSMFASSFRPARSKHCLETRFETSIVTAPRVRHCCGIGFELLRLSFSSGLMPGLLVRPKQLEGTFCPMLRNISVGYRQFTPNTLDVHHREYRIHSCQRHFLITPVLISYRMEVCGSNGQYFGNWSRTDTEQKCTSLIFYSVKNGKVLNRIFFLAWSLIKLHVVQSPPGMAASWAILGVTARMILCSAVPSKCFFRCGHLRNHCRTPHSLTYFSFGGKVVCFFDPIITSCRPSECTKHICGGCSHTEVRHVFSRADRHRAECPECGCGKVFDDGMCHNRMRLTRPNMAQPCCPVCDGAGGTDNHQGTLICSSWQECPPGVLHDSTHNFMTSRPFKTRSLASLPTNGGVPGLHGKLRRCCSACRLATSYAATHWAPPRCPIPAAPLVSGQAAAFATSRLPGARPGVTIGRAGAVIDASVHVRWFARESFNVRPKPRCRPLGSCCCEWRGRLNVVFSALDCFRSVCGHLYKSWCASAIFIQWSYSGLTDTPGPGPLRVVKQTRVKNIKIRRRAPLRLYPTRWHTNNQQPFNEPGGNESAMTAFRAIMQEQIARGLGDTEWQPVTKSEDFKHES